MKTWWKHYKIWIIRQQYLLILKVCPHIIVLEDDDYAVIAAKGQVPMRVNKITGAHKRVKVIWKDS